MHMVRAIRRPDMLKIEQALLAKGLLARDPYASHEVLGDVRICSPAGHQNWRGVQIHQTGRCVIFDASDPHKRITLCGVDPMHEFQIQFTPGWHQALAEQVAILLDDELLEFSAEASVVPTPVVRQPRPRKAAPRKAPPDVPEEEVPEEDLEIPVYPAEDGWVEAKAVGVKGFEVPGIFFRIVGKQVEFGPRWPDGRRISWDGRPKPSRIRNTGIAENEVYVPDAILRTLVGPPQKNCHARVKDGDLGNLHPSNLEWKKIRNKYTEKQKAAIIADWGAGLAKKHIRAKYDVSDGYVDALVKGPYADRTDAPGKRAGKRKQFGMTPELEAARRAALEMRLAGGHFLDGAARALMERFGVENTETTQPLTPAP